MEDTQSILMKVLAVGAGASVFVVALGFFLCFLLCKALIPILRNWQKKGQPIRVDGPSSHVSKRSTPTMGGLFIGGAIVFLTLLFIAVAFFMKEKIVQGTLVSVINIKELLGVDNWGTLDRDNHIVFDTARWPVWIVNLWKILGVMVIFVGYMVIGFLDDYKKVAAQDAYKGLSPKQKLTGQILFAMIGISCIQYGVMDPWWFNLPFGLSFTVWWVYLPFATLVIVGSSNAVNLTDGLDGLATKVLIKSFLGYLFLALAYGHLDVSVLLLLTMGILFGFLKFNKYPAKIFMGDVGSLSLGGMLGAISVALKLEYVLPIIGAVFVIETLSVILQVCYFRKTGGKRFFLMAPLHHHFEQKGWKETKVVGYFNLLAWIFLFLGIVVWGFAQGKFLIKYFWF